MASPEELSGGGQSVEMEGARLGINRILLSASSRSVRSLGAESARRILDLRDDDHVIGQDVIDQIQANLQLLEEDIPIIQALRTVDDFPVGDSVFFRQPDEENSQFMTAEVSSPTDTIPQRVVLKFDKVISYVLPGYSGLMSKDDMDYIRHRPKHLSISPLYVNLTVTRFMTVLGFGEYCSETMYGYLTRFNRTTVADKY